MPAATLECPGCGKVSHGWIADEEVHGRCFQCEDCRQVWGWSAWPPQDRATLPQLQAFLAACGVEID